MTSSYLDQELVQAIASVMARRVEARGIEKVGERKDLEPSTVAVLGAAFPGRVEKERRVTIPDWEQVGNVDIVVRSDPSKPSFAALVELKWAGPGDDIIYEAIYDLFKLALASRREDQPRTYLLTGAAKAHWEQSAFADLFRDAEHEPEELCRRRLPGKQQRLAWDALLQGANDSHPLALPFRIRTKSTGRSSVGDWELRAVEVSISNAAVVPLTGGWPWAERPDDAKHPSPTTAP
jgi:hypothetical protein